MTQDQRITNAIVQAQGSNVLEATIPTSLTIAAYQRSRQGQDRAARRRFRRWLKG